MDVNYPSKVLICDYQQLIEFEIPGSVNCDGCLIQWNQEIFLDDPTLTNPTINASYGGFPFDRIYEVVITNTINGMECIEEHEIEFSTIQIDNSYTIENLSGCIDLLTYQLDIKDTDCIAEENISIKFTDSNTQFDLQYTVVQDANSFIFQVPYNKFTSGDILVEYNLVTSASGDIVVGGICSESELVIIPEFEGFRPFMIWTPQAICYWDGPNVSGGLGPNGYGAYYWVVGGGYCYNAWFPRFGNVWMENGVCQGEPIYDNPVNKITYAKLWIFDRWGKQVWEKTIERGMSEPAFTGYELRWFPIINCSDGCLGDASCAGNSPNDEIYNYCRFSNLEFQPHPIGQYTYRLDIGSNYNECSVGAGTAVPSSCGLVCQEESSYIKCDNGEALQTFHGSFTRS